MNNNKDTLQDTFMQVVRLNFKRAYELLTKIDIHPGQQHLLMHLAEDDGQSLKELTKKLEIKPATVTVMVQRMEKSGLVVKKPDEKDQRVSRIFITAKGHDICKKIEKIIEQMERECFEGFTVEEKIIFRRLLLQMRNNIEEKMKQEE